MAVFDGRAQQQVQGVAADPHVHPHLGKPRLGHVAADIADVADDVNAGQARGLNELLQILLPQRQTLLQGLIGVAVEVPAAPEIVRGADDEVQGLPGGDLCGQFRVVVGLPQFQAESDFRPAGMCLERSAQSCSRPGAQVFKAEGVGLAGLKSVQVTVVGKADVLDAVIPGRPRISVMEFFASLEQWLCM